MTLLRTRSNLFFASLLCMLAAASGSAQTADRAFPDAPGVSSTADDPQQAAAQPAGQEPADTGPAKRLFFIIPNFRSVRTTVTLPRQTVKEKSVDATEDTFDYSAFSLELILAGYGQATNATPQFGTGGVAFGRYLWHAVADQSIENYLVEFIVPVATKEDTRFYQLGHGGFGKRTGYALTRIFICRSDSDHWTFNAGEVVGAGISSALSQLYYPGAQRTVGNFADKYVTNLGIDAAAFFVREFEPEITKAMTRHPGPKQ